MGSSSSKPAKMSKKEQKAADEYWHREMAMHRGYVKREKQVQQNRKARAADARHEAALMRANGADGRHVHNHQRTQYTAPRAVRAMYEQQGYQKQKEAQQRAQGKKWQDELEAARKRTAQRQWDEKLKADREWAKKQNMAGKSFLWD